MKARRCLEEEMGKTRRGNQTKPLNRGRNEAAPTLSYLPSPRFVTRDTFSSPRQASEGARSPGFPFKRAAFFCRGRQKRGEAVGWVRRAKGRGEFTSCGLPTPKVGRCSALVSGPNQLANQPHNSEALSGSPSSFGDDFGGDAKARTHRGQFSPFCPEPVSSVPRTISLSLPPSPERGLVLPSPCQGKGTKKQNHSHKPLRVCYKGGPFVATSSLKNLATTSDK